MIRRVFADGFCVTVCAVMSITPDKIALLVLGSGEIARLLVTLAHHADYTITVCDDNVGHYSWPEDITLNATNFSEQPWPLTQHTHAIIARGHQGDAENLLSLLQHDAGHVYLIASAARSQGIIDQVSPLLPDPSLLKRLSAPAGLSLGGQSSYEIALSILAEIQWRSHDRQPIQPLTELRASRLDNSSTGQRFQSCPGKRP